MLPAADAQTDEFLSQLITTHAEPVIKGIDRYKLHLRSPHGAERAEADYLKAPSLPDGAGEGQTMRKHTLRADQNMSNDIKRNITYQF